jgi:PAS domain-containing protein
LAAQAAELGYASGVAKCRLQDGVFIADQSGCVLMVNDAARAIIGVSDEESARRLGERMCFAASL